MISRVKQSEEDIRRGDGSHSAVNFLPVYREDFIHEL